MNNLFNSSKNFVRKNAKYIVVGGLLTVVYLRAVNSNS